MTDLCTKDEISTDKIRAYCETVLDICTPLMDTIGALLETTLPDIGRAPLVFAETTRRTLLSKRLQELCGWTSLSKFIAFHLPKWLLWKIPWTWLMEEQNNDNL